jgi:hypothetical protein
MCGHIKQEISKLKAQLAAVQDTIEPPDPDEPGGPHKPKVPPGAKAQINALAAKIKAKTEQYRDCIANANPAPAPLRIDVTSITCVDETDGPGDDEPYLLTVAVERRAAGGGLPLPIPQLRVNNVGPWEGVADGEHHGMSSLPTADRRPIWGRNGQPAEIRHPDDVILLLALMENDGANPHTVRQIVDSMMVGTIMNNIQSDRPAQVTALRETLVDAIDTARVDTSFPFDHDERIGGIRELRLTRFDLNWALMDSPRGFSFTFKGDGAHYGVNVSMRRP